MKALLFDMDGVLVDVSRSYRIAVQRVVRRFSGRGITAAAIQRYKNLGGLNNDWDLCACILRTRGIRVNRKSLRACFQREYRGCGKDGLNLRERWLLEEDILLRLQRNFRLGIVTGRPRRDARFTLKRFSKMPLFAVVISRDDIPVSRQKPHPLGLIVALRRLGVDTGYYLGDSVDDMSAAREAGLAGIGVLNGALVAAEQSIRLREAGACRVLADINHILEVVS